ncbi:MAG: hypothetical protein ACK4UN_15560 [Limisphaerales bacterium]
MRINLVLSLVCTLLLSTAMSGCTTKTKAQIQAQQAFIAGQQQAMAQMQQQQPGNVIQVVGDVQQPQIIWSDGLTLAETILAAGYRGFRDPQEIIIYRHGQAISVNPKALLRGEDELVEPGDRIILR